MEDNYVTPLGRAIALWQAGKRIPLDLFAALVEEGYDVPALERAHYRPN